MEESPLVGLAAEFAKAKERLREEQRQSKENIKLANKRDEVQFKAIHGLLVMFFLWIFALHASGIYLFTRGFLLTRLVLEEQSTCNVSPVTPVDGIGPPTTLAQDNGCWHPKTFDKAVIVVIDALRFDFTVPSTPQNSSDGSYPHQFHDALTVLSEVATEQPNNAVLFPFIADPPTATLQRLKGLTTGTLPTFIDAGSNFAGTAIDEDNLIAQLRTQGKKIAFLGDDTWMALFGHHFEESLTHPYDSFNVWDLHTVDNGVNEHIFPLLHPEESHSWDILIGHYLGVDHAGHRYGPDHPAMNTKLKQMDRVIRDLIQAVDDDTLLVVMGDHGMDPKGDHGGESQLEVEAALWMYSRKGIFGRNQGLSVSDDPRPVAQIDLVPTLALLLGIPIPFNNLGAPIPEAFLGPTGDNWENLAEVARITNAQILRYQKEYSTKRSTDAATDSKSTAFWSIAEDKYQALRGGAEGSSPSVQEWESLYHDLAAYQKENLRVCKDLWARFDLGSMFAGIVVLVASIAAVAVFARGIRGDKLEILGILLQRIATGMSVGVAVAFFSGFVVSIGLSRVNITILGATMGSLVGYASGVAFIRRRLVSLLPSSPWSVLAVVFTVGHAVLFASNSFVIWEDKVLNFFLATFGVGGLINSQRQANLTQRALGTYHSVVFLVLTRVASLSRLCREEQMPFCKSTFYASANSSVSSPYSLVLLFIMAAALPAIIKSFYVGTKSYEGLAGFWVGFSFRLGLALNAVYWTLDSADNGEWITMDEKLLKAVKMLIAQVVLALGFIAGHVGFAWAQICLGIEVKQKNGSKSTKEKEGDAKTGDAKTGEKVVTQSGETVALLGYSNLHGSRFLLLVVSWSLCLILVQKPLGGVSIGILLWQVLNVLEILDCNDLSASAIGPVVLGVLGNAHFFSTGHQATLPSIQWETAFIPFSTIVYPWSPLLITLNTVGPQILTALAIPLIGLWKKDPKTPGLLSGVAVSAATYLVYQSVVSMAAAACAGWLRRHLMLHKIFSPRFMLGGVVLLVADVVVGLVAVGALRWNVPAVAEVFGYLY